MPGPILTEAQLAEAQETALRVEQITKHNGKDYTPLEAHKWALTKVYNSPDELIAGSKRLAEELACNQSTNTETGHPRLDFIRFRFFGFAPWKDFTSKNARLTRSEQTESDMKGPNLKPLCSEWISAFKTLPEHYPLEIVYCDFERGFRFNVAYMKSFVTRLSYILKTRTKGIVEIQVLGCRTLDGRLLAESGAWKTRKSLDLPEGYMYQPDPEKELLAGPPLVKDMNELATEWFEREILERLKRMLVMGTAYDSKKQQLNDPFDREIYRPKRSAKPVQQEAQKKQEAQKSCSQQ